MATMNRSWCMPLRFPFSLDGERKDEHASLMFVVVCSFCEAIRAFRPTEEGVVSKDVAENCPSCSQVSVPLIVGE
jgi:hypothetical protein